MDNFHQITIKELENKEKMLEAFPVFAKRYDGLTMQEFEQQLGEMIDANNFKIIAAYSDNKIIGVAGYWLLRMFYCGRYIQVSSLIVDEEKRGAGIGGMLLQQIEKIAKKLDCKKIILDAFTENKKSHSLYYRENFYIRGLHFMKDL